MTDPVAITSRVTPASLDPAPARAAVGPRPVERREPQPVKAFLKAIEPFFQEQSITYVDVGAHRGNVLKAVVENGPRLREALLVEPNPTSFAALQERVAALNLAENVRCFNLALSDSPGRLSLRDADDMTKVVEPASDEGVAGRIFEIEAVTLDTLSGELHKPHINLLKIDVEGFELAVLAGAKGLLAEQAVDMIYIEAGLNPASTQQTYYREIEDALSAHGYRLFRIFEQTHEWREDSPFLRRVNLAFMSPRFAAAHPYRLCAKLLALRQEAEASARALKDAVRTGEERLAAETLALRQETEALKRDRAAEAAAYERALEEAVRKGEERLAAETRALRQETEALKRDRAAEAAAFERAKVEIQQARRSEVRELQEQLAGKLGNLTSLLSEANARLADERRASAAARAELSELRKYAGRLEAKYAELLESETWRAMEPVRKVMRMVKGGRKPAPFVPRLAGRAPGAGTRKAAKAAAGTSRKHAKAPGPAEGKNAPAASPGQVAEVRRYDHHLWGGLSRPAVRELERVLADPAYAPDCRFDAAHKLATWYAFDGDLETALRVIRAIDDVAPARRNARARLMKEAFIHLKRGDRAAARAAFERLLGQKGNERNPDATLALANCLPDDDARLAQINKVFARAGRVGIERRDPSRPLALDNIRGQPAACALPDLGKVSVIMPTYAAEDTLRMAIRSVQEQTYRNLEIIVVDDCSPDATHSVAIELAKTDERIIAIRQERNGGAYAARNRGLEAATGAFITTHDADDWSHPQKIERQLAFLQTHPEVMGVCTHWARTTRVLEITPNWRIGDPVIHWSHPSFLFRRVVLDRLGPWDPVRVGADTEFVWRLQAAFGDEAFRKIETRVPMAFAMDDASSLTRTKQTHVRTIHYGLRHIYRAVARRSHAEPGGTGTQGAGRRLAALPARLKESQKAPLALDFMLMGNCCDEAIVAQMAAWLDGAEAAGKRVGIAHWPDFKAAPSALSPAYAELLLSRGVIPVPPQTEVSLATRLGIFFGDCTVEPDALPVVVPAPA